MFFGRSKSRPPKAGTSLKDRIGVPQLIDPINVSGSYIDLRKSPLDASRPLQLPEVPQVSLSEGWNAGGNKDGNDAARRQDVARDGSLRGDQSHPRSPAEPKSQDEALRFGGTDGQEKRTLALTPPPSSDSAGIRKDRGARRGASQSPHPDAPRGRTSERLANTLTVPKRSSSEYSSQYSTPAAALRLQSAPLLMRQSELDQQLPPSSPHSPYSQYQLQPQPGSPYKTYQTPAPLRPRENRPEKLSLQALTKDKSDAVRYFDSYPDPVSPLLPSPRGDNRMPRERSPSSRRNHKPPPQTELGREDKPRGNQPGPGREERKQNPQRAQRTAHKPADEVSLDSKSWKEHKSRRDTSPVPQRSDKPLPRNVSPARPRHPRGTSPPPPIPPPLAITPAIPTATTSTLPLPELPSIAPLDVGNNEDMMVDISFADFSMPPPRTQSARTNMIISAPRSLSTDKLPNYLGRLQPVQRGADDHNEAEGSPVDDREKAGPKRSLHRKVSMKLRGLGRPGGAKGEPSPDRGGNPHTNFPKQVVSTPITIPEDERIMVDPNIQRMFPNFDPERDGANQKTVERVQSKADDWGYSRSAASSASNLSLRQSDTSAGNPGLSSHRSSLKSSERTTSPVTPADDVQTFSALRGPAMPASETAKSDIAIKPRGYHQSTVSSIIGKGNDSEDVPMFLDAGSEDNSTTGAPNFAHAPPDTEPGHITLALDPVHNPAHDSFLTEPEHFLRKPGRGSGGQVAKADKARVLRNPGMKVTTNDIERAGLPAASPTTPGKRRPPFGPGGMMLRSATMSSRQPGNRGNRPVKPSPVAEEHESQGYAAAYTSPAITQEDFVAATRSPSSGVAVSESTILPRRPGSVEKISPPSSESSFASSVRGTRSEDPEIYPDDSISRINSPPPVRSPTAFDFDRALPRQPSLRQAKSHTNLRNDRVAALSHRPSTSRGPQLHLETDNTPIPIPIPNSSGIDRPRSPNAFDVDRSLVPASAVDTTPPNPSLLGVSQQIKRSKSVGGGLRRAFSRRKPAENERPTAAAAAAAAPAPPNSIPEEIIPPSPSVVSYPLSGGMSSTSQARWNTAIRAAATSAALARPATTATATPARPMSVVLKAQPLTEQDRGKKHAPGTLFLRTVEQAEDGEGEEKEHTMKPRKGGLGMKCGFCGKGPFANMWVCVDEDCGSDFGAGIKGERLVCCRMCCNVMMQDGSAEIF